MLAAMTASFDVTSMVGALGAEIRGTDLAKPIDDTTFDAIHRAFLEYQVLCFRDQRITPEQQLAFARRFGEVDTYPFIEPLAGHPGVIPIVKEATTRVNFGGGWHTDGSYMPEPPKATLLYAIETPESGGDTVFGNMYAAYDALSDGMKSLLNRQQAVFTAAGVHGSSGAYQNVKAGDAEKRPDEARAEAREDHPVFRTHPETGRRAIYVGRFHVERLCGMRAAESAPILDYLTTHAVRPEFTMRLRWAPGTLVLWDNRCVQHNALNDYFGERREMHRTTIKGDRPA